jgi:hypothetical protein
MAPKSWILAFLSAALALSSAGGGHAADNLFAALGAQREARLHREFQGRGLQVVGVSLGGDAHTVRGFARRLNIPFPLVLDEDGESPRLFGLWGHPNTVLIDRGGRVIGLVRGEQDWQSEAARRVVGELVQQAAGETGERAPSHTPAATILGATISGT